MPTEDERVLAGSRGRAGIEQRGQREDARRSVVRREVGDIEARGREREARGHGVHHEEPVARLGGVEPHDELAERADRIGEGLGPARRRVAPLRRPRRERGEVLDRDEPTCEEDAVALRSMGPRRRVARRGLPEQPDERAVRAEAREAPAREGLLCRDGPAARLGVRGELVDEARGRVAGRRRWRGERPAATPLARLELRDVDAVSSPCAARGTGPRDRGRGEQADVAQGREHGEQHRESGHARSTASARRGSVSAAFFPLELAEARSPGSCVG